MLKIRQAQFDALAQYSLDGYIERVVVDLKERFPAEIAEQRLRPPDLDRLASEGLARARLHNIVLESDVIRYIECMLLLGQEFDSNQNYPWAVQTLRRPDLDGTAKMDHIDECRIFCLARPV